MHQSENIKIKLITIINRDKYSWLILLYARVNENQKLNHGGTSQAPTQWLGINEEAVIESEARTAVVQSKSEA